MKKIILLIFLIGFSVGLISASTINIISGKSEYKAKPKPIVKNDENQKIIEEKEKIDTTENKDEDPFKPKDVPVPDEYVTIKIESGYTSEIVADVLYDNQLISNKESFNTLIKSLKLSSKIKVGEKTIRKGSSMNEIINIITS